MVKSNDLYAGERLRRMANGGTRFSVCTGNCKTVPVAEVFASGDGNVSDSPVERPGCGTVGTEKWGLSGYPLAMVYSPLQKFAGLYDVEKGYHRGTIFSELDLPLECVNMGRGGNRRNG